MAIDLFETRYMLEALEQGLTPNSFLRDTFFKNVRNFESENVDVDIYKGKRKTAVYVSPIDEGKVISRNGYTTSSYKAPYINHKMVTTAEDVMKRSYGEIVYQNGMTPEDRAAEILAKDMTELDEMITRAEELQAAQAMFTGTITVKDAAVIDFGMANTHKITLVGNDLWSDTTNSDPLAKMRAWRRLLIKDSGVTPDTVILSPEALDALLAHPKVTAKLDLLKLDNGQVDFQTLPNGVTYIGRLKDIGCDLWTYDEWYLDSADNTEKPYVPEKKVWMGSTRARFDRLYGVIKNMKALYSVPRFPSSWVTEDPSARWIKMESSPLLVPVQVDSFLYAQVLS
jgi:hypothetical protein